MPACDKAVALAPENKKVSYQDSRGVARTLAGNYQGAIEDLDAYLKQNKTDLEEAKSQEDTVTLPQEYNAVLTEPLIEQAKSRVKRQISQRQRWIDALRNGKKSIYARGAQRFVKRVTQLWFFA
jgi:hypothetical protein